VRRYEMAFDPITAALDAAKEAIKRIWPEPMSKEAEAKVDAALTSSFRSFVLEYEGRMIDYTRVKFFGPLLILIRGTIRPGFTIADAYWLNEYFLSGTEWPAEKVMLLKIVTVLVLIFWFGERAVKYVMPLLTKFMEVKRGG
jgi:hypothetical protein